MKKFIAFSQLKIWLVKFITRVTSMLITDVGEEMCWLQLQDSGDSFGQFSHKHSKDVTKIETPSPTSENCRQL